MCPGRWFYKLAYCVALCLALTVAKADVFVGVFSYDTFIPAGDGAPGVDAFNVANFTGSFGLPPDFPAADDLIFQSASINLFQGSTLWNTFTLGDIGPGFALDGFGNPLLQVPDDVAFTSAEFIATLSPLTFTLADGNLFTVSSGSIDTLLLPSSDSDLTVDVDNVLISVPGTEHVASTPEPASVVLLLTGIACLALRVRASRA